MKLFNSIHDFFIRHVSNDLATALKIVREVIRGKYVFTFLADGPRPDSDLASATEDEILRRFSEFPVQTQKLLCSYIEYLNKVYLAPPPNSPYFFCREVKTVFPISFDEKDFLKERRNYEKMLHKYQFNYLHAGPESLLNHHGMKKLPVSVKLYMQGRDFIDAGAFAGDSSIVFSHYFPRKIYAFEPSRKNRELFLHYTRQNRLSPELYELVPKGIGDKEANICIHDSGGAGQEMRIPGESLLELTTVDHFVEERNLLVGVIKADLEGMGLQMLKGAVKTIQKDRPVLTLAIYHNREEFFGIYEFLRELNLNYRFEIHACRAPILELTLLAYPEELK